MRKLHDNRALIMALLLAMAATSGRAALTPTSTGAQGTFDACTDRPLRDLPDVVLNAFFTSDFVLPAAEKEVHIRFQAELDDAIAELKGRTKGTLELRAFLEGGGSQVLATEQIRSRRKTPHLIEFAGTVPWNDEIGALVATFAFKGKESLSERGVGADEIALCARIDVAIKRIRASLFCQIPEY